MQISIIIPNYLFERELLDLFKVCVERIRAHTIGYKYELILVDNGSILGSDEIRNNADVYIRNEVNIGFAKSCNQGFRIASGEWIACMNNDVFVYPGWIENLIKAFDEVSFCGIMAPKELKHIKNVQEAIDLKDISEFVTNRYYRDYFGSLWVTKKEILDRVKVNDCVFDENYKFGCYEDSDLYLRIKKLGLDCYKTKRTRVFHKSSATIRKMKIEKEIAENEKYFREKWNWDWNSQIKGWKEFVKAYRY